MTKWTKKGLVAALSGILLLGAVLVLLNATAEEATYVGSETCMTCHKDTYNEFKASGHPYKLRPAEEARAAGIPKPDYVSWDDILFVIGGFGWKARYIGQDGYIITQNADGTIKGQNQFNLETEQFVDYHAGEEKPYNCGKCHTTGYSPEGHQVVNGVEREGIIGTWALEGIQCEACHGPGSKHASTGNPEFIQVNRSKELCGQCHIRGEAETIPAKGGFIRHHEQYNELLASPHSFMDCVTCHDPHKRSGLSIENDCATCHSDEAAEFAGSAMQQAGLSCTDCHMPAASKSAVKHGPYEGDVMTHLFKINADPTAPMFTEDGSFANGYLTLDFACLPCHADRDKAWAAEYAPKAHTLGK